jgi:hypothetical protein
MVGKAPRPSYDELAAQVAELREVVRSLQAENARLRAELAHVAGAATPEAAPATPTPAPPAGRRTPPRWAKANVPVPDAERPPRKRRMAVPGRRRERPDRRILYAPQHCPACQARLRRGRVVQRRQVIDLPVSRVQIIEHVVLERRCRHCGTRCRGQVPDLAAQVGAHRRVSWRVTALVALLRTKLRLPIAQLQWLLHQVWGLRLSVGELCALVQEAAAAGQRTYAALLDEVRTSPVAHVDETGWREDGRNGFVWTISTPRTRLFHFVSSRAGAVIRELLGPTYAGVTVSDFYTAYDQLDGRHQRCWAHFLRDVHDLRQAHPTDAVLTAWAKQVHDLYAQAVTWAASAQARSPAEREAARLGFERALLACCRDPAPGAHPHRTLCQRVERYHPEFFTFVAVPEVPPTNNAAERALRPLVVARKISGGTRSADGTTTRMVLQSLVATWERRGQEPYAALLALLQAPRDPVSILVPV